MPSRSSGHQHGTSGVKDSTTSGGGGGTARRQHNPAPQPGAPGAKNTQRRSQRAQGRKAGGGGGHARKQPTTAPRPRAPKAGTTAALCVAEALFCFSACPRPAAVCASGEAPTFSWGGWGLIHPPSPRGDENGGAYPPRAGASNGGRGTTTAPSPRHRRAQRRRPACRRNGGRGTTTTSHAATACIGEQRGGTAPPMERRAGEGDHNHPLPAPQRHLSLPAGGRLRPEINFFSYGPLDRCLSAASPRLAQAAQGATPPAGPWLAKAAPPPIPWPAHKPERAQDDEGQHPRPHQARQGYSSALRET